MSRRSENSSIFAATPANDDPAPSHVWRWWLALATCAMIAGAMFANAFPVTP